MITHDEKAQWVEALRSEKYKQGRNCLHKDGKFCCLGVLADLLDTYERTDKGFTVPSKILGSGIRIDTIAFLEYAEVSPTIQNTLIDFNDTKKLNFAEIADWIEENVPSCDPS